MSRAATSLLFLGQLTFALTMIPAFALFTLGMVIPYALSMSGGLLWLLAAGWCLFMVIGQIGAIFRYFGLPLLLIIPWWVLYFLFFGPWFMDQAASLLVWQVLGAGTLIALALLLVGGALKLIQWVAEEPA